MEEWEVAFTHKANIWFLLFEAAVRRHREVTSDLSVLRMFSLDPQDSTLSQNHRFRGKTIQSCSKLYFSCQNISLHSLNVRHSLWTVFMWGLPFNCLRNRGKTWQHGQRPQITHPIGRLCHFFLFLPEEWLNFSWNVNSPQFLHAI